jgi:L-lactate dehydrogenase complex protein LldF
VYGGPIGSVISSSLEPARSAPDLPFASSLCGACADVCPVKIRLPELLLHLRDRQMQSGPEFGVQGPTEMLPARGVQRAAMRAWAFAMRGRTRYRGASRLLRVMLAPLARHGWIRGIPGPLGGWTAVRDLPLPARRTFIEEYEARRAR